MRAVYIYLEDPIQSCAKATFRADCALLYTLPKAWYLGLLCVRSAPNAGNLGKNELLRAECALWYLAHRSDPPMQPHTPNSTHKKTKTNYSYPASTKGAAVCLSITMKSVKWLQEHTVCVELLFLLCIKETSKLLKGSPDFSPN